MVLVVLAAGPAAAQSTAPQPFEVRYLEGSVQVQLRGTTKWTSLKVEAKVPGDATVRLAKGALLELADGSKVLSLIKQGIYDLALVAGRAPASGGLASAVATKLRVLTSERQQASSAGGTRADMCDEPQKFANGGCTDPAASSSACTVVFVHWGVRAGSVRVYPAAQEFLDDAGLAIDMAIRDLLRGNYAKAVARLKPHDDVRGTDRDFLVEVRYLLASAYAESGQSALAWKLLSGLTVKPGDRAYRDVLVRRAQVLVDCGAAEDALTALKPLLDPLERSEYGQAASLVAWQAWLALDNPKLAAEARQRGIGIAPDSPTGKLLASLP
jgi:hypothetical protein